MEGSTACFSSSSPSLSAEPAEEAERLFFVRSTGLLDTKASEAFDRLTRMAIVLLKVPIAAISILDESRQWFKSRVGIEVSETPRKDSFCTRTIEAADVMVVEDALTDPRFAHSALVTGSPHIRFYAGAPLRLSSGHPIGSLCIIDTKPRTLAPADVKLLQDLAALVMAQIDLHQMAGRVNEVTRLPNRAQLAEDLTAACVAEPELRRTCMLIDVMSSAQLQSAVRAVGISPLEVALRAIATSLIRTLPPEALLYHVAETRFAILRPYKHDADDALFASGLMSHISKPFVTEGGIPVKLNAVAGLAAFRHTQSETDDVLRRATSALYQAHSEQKSWTPYSPDFDLPHRRAHNLLRAIPKSLASGEFRLVYQPQINLHTARISGVESLARWRHPDFGDVPPSEFVELLERTTLIHDFTEWALHSALQQIAAWNLLGIELTVSVNVSARNLEHPQFLRVLRNALALYRVHPSSLRIECTETAVMTGSATVATLEGIRAMDIGVSLDDFGIGYSNLACLHSLPVQTLKLDQTLIKPIATNERAFKLVQALISMGHTLGYRMLAEGVETAEVLDLLKHDGCDAVQGYYISRPLESHAIPAFLQTSRGPYLHDSGMHKSC